MSPDHPSDLRFGDIAVAQGFITPEVLAHALEIQKTVCDRARVQVPVGRVMVGMDIMTQAQVDAVLAIQQQETPPSDMGSDATVLEGSEESAFRIAVAEDRLTVYLVPTGADVSQIDVREVQQQLTSAGITHGLIPETQMADLIGGLMTIDEQLVIARGTPMTPAVADTWEMRFDTDPLRAGTLGEDGRMDWKNRGDIPQVQAGDVLAELCGGDPGVAGTDVYGKLIEPAVPKAPTIKMGKGAERSEDGRQVLARMNGMPKLMPDGRIDVMNRMTIDGDVGVETGHVNFDGVIVVNGVITRGYRVKAKELHVREIQEATVTVHEHLVVAEGVYGSLIQVGGNFKASHVHDTTIAVTGDLAVAREIIDSTVVVTGRCLIPSGSILSSTVSAKKGIQANDVGTQAAKPSRLTIGVDQQLTLDLNAIAEEISELKKEAADGAATVEALKAEREKLSERIEEAATLQDDRTRRLHKLEEEADARKGARDPEFHKQIREAIDKLSDKIRQGEAAVEAMMAEDDDLEPRIHEAETHLAMSTDLIEEARKRSEMLKETAKLDPGHPILKVFGHIYVKTEINSPKDRIVIDEILNHVQFMESQDEETKTDRLKQVRLR